MKQILTLVLLLTPLAASLPQSWVPEGRKKGGKGGGAEE